MLTADSRVFLNTQPTGHDRVLHPATVTQVESGTLTVRLDEQHLQFATGQTVEVFYERTRKFVKQIAHIESVTTEDEDGEPELSVSFVTTTDAEVVESRQHYRVVTLMENLTTSVADEDARLADVSECGFSAIARGQLDLAAPVDVTLRFEHAGFRGTATVQSIKPLPGGSTRYGFICTEHEKDLRRGLRTISMEVQRRQLRRMKAA